MKKIIIFFSIFIFVGLLVFLQLIVKVKIDCKSQYGACSQQILDKINTLNGKSLYVAKSGVGKIMKSEFQVSDYSAQYKIPNTLHLEILMKKVIAGFRGDLPNSIILVNINGEIVSQATESALPVINIQGGMPKVGQNIGSSNLFAMNLATGVYQMYQVSQSSIQEGSLLVELPGQIRVIFPLEGDIQALLGSLRLIYSKIREDGNLAMYSQIDLRFVNPVLR